MHSRSDVRQPEFLPMTRDEMDALGWDELDVLLVSGDAYVDHPSFGVPLLGRWLVEHGFRTGIVAQPPWDRIDAMTVMGRPRLFVGISAGCLDSMLAHYTAFRKKRRDDAYTPGGKAGARPNRAALVYANLAKRAFSGLPVVLGGIEASLRRVSHYDFWSDSLRRSLVLDSKATAILYGMAEVSILQLARALDQASHVGSLDDPDVVRTIVANLPGVAYATSLAEAETLAHNAEVPLTELPSHEAIVANPAQLVRATRLLEQHVHQSRATAIQVSGKRAVVLTAPGAGLAGQALDGLMELPFQRRAHPVYTDSIPAEEMIRSSVAGHRGCGGGCSFCALALHQGRRIRSRSRESILREVKRLRNLPEFRGSVTDVGGPSANMWGAHCSANPDDCARASCLFPGICPHFIVDQSAFVSLLRDIAGLDGVRHVRVASGWRMDLALQDKAALGIMIREFVGGQAKVAPEHICDEVLHVMRKPRVGVFERFLQEFDRQSNKVGKKQFVIPYLMSGHPGCTLSHMRELGEYLAARNWRPQQVQCFIPLPGTMAAAIFYAGVDERGRPVYVAKSDADRLKQHGLLVPVGTTPMGKRTVKHAESEGPRKEKAATRSKHSSERREKSLRAKQNHTKKTGAARQGKKRFQH
ncbi:YgiQ family radical SAM protein [Desulfovibrio inopinatus]|uniref:YgiQ family radical SAM protein n=1 Tax=Desulfovibrio inopinatus TaxID=102109 RepID=UPI0003F4F622|nr:YgiQ family radical SAM protein [Desulfovibrio inopinatus]